ncbi:NAD-dependent epimerase/dehydratase family protein [bacterium]|nr:NAD-dependent epimerase/dehydratase family protein [bacterium]
MLTNKRVLITGATGFVGANLVKSCLKKGADIYLLTRATSNKWRINDILKDVSEFSADLTDNQAVEKLVLTIRPEIIFHTAVYGGFPYQRDLKKTIDTNLLGTINLIEACEKVGFKLFINTGSSSEYGVKEEPIKEDSPLTPFSSYGISKAFATQFCQMKFRTGLPVITLRLFSPYGYYEGATRLIPSVILSSLKDIAPEVSSPTSVRDFVFIEDVVNAYLKAVDMKDRLNTDVFNIGSGLQHSVGEVVEKILFLTGKKIKPKWGSVSNPRIEPKIWQADISKTEQILNWQPKHSLDNGLNKTLIWFKENSLMYEGEVSNGDIL